MKKVICLIACFSIAVFAQNWQPPPQPMPPQQQGQYQYPPPQQPPQGGQYQYPPPPPQPMPPPSQQQPMPPQQIAPQPKQASIIGTQLGVRAGIVMNSFSTGDSDKDKYIDMGMGFGVGGVASFPITDIIFFGLEADFLYRTLYNISESGYEESASEYAISIPLTIQVMPVAGMPIHFAGGIQIDLPFSATKKESGGGHSETEDIDERKVLDLGIAIGAGYRVLPNIGVDLKAVIGFTNLTSYEDDDSSLSQFGLGVSYFF